MKKLLIPVILISSCYTEIKKPDAKFLQLIKNQSTIDSTLQTKISLNPKNTFFGSKNLDEIKGVFFVKNEGIRNFNIASIRPDCDCIALKYTETKEIKTGDSLMINYSFKKSKVKGKFSNVISIVGNCPFGNQTFLFEGIIY